jgi:hypothetical protein
MDVAQSSAFSCSVSLIHFTHSISDLALSLGFNHPMLVTGEVKESIIKCVNFPWKFSSPTKARGKQNLVVILFLYFVPPVEVSKNRCSKTF